MRWPIVLSLVLTLWGCGVPKTVWLNEVEQKEEFEKQLAICEAGQRTQQRQAEALQRERDAVAEKAAAATERSDGLQEKLTAAVAGGQGVRATLETCQQARTAAEQEVDRLRTALETEKSLRMEDVARGRELAAELEVLRGNLAESREQVARTAAESEEIKAQLAGMEGRLTAYAEERERLEQEKAAKVAEVERSYEELLQGMEAELEKGQVTISQLRGKLSVNVLDEILFASGRAEINPQGQEVLARVGEVLKGMADKTIVIEGHTDSIPVSGALAKVYASNWELSAARATSVVRYLQTTAGIAPERLSAVGLGPFHPVDTNDTEEGRARNRRIEIKLVPQETVVDEPAAVESPADDPQR